MTTLKDIREISDKGCFDDPARIESIVTEFVTTPVGELYQHDEKAKKHVYEPINLIYGVEGSILDRIVYPEMVCLINHIDQALDPENKPYSGDYSAEQLRRYVTHGTKIALLSAGKRNLLVREFLGIGVKPLFQFLESRYRDHAADHVYCRYRTREKRILRLSESGVQKLFPRKTIGEVLYCTAVISNRSWRCWEEITGYQLMMLEANKIDTDILLSGFAKAYREKMDLADTMAHCSLDAFLQMEPGNGYEGKNSTEKR